MAQIYSGHVYQRRFSPRKRHSYTPSAPQQQVICLREALHKSVASLLGGSSRVLVM